MVEPKKLALCKFCHGSILMYTTDACWSWIHNEPWRLPSYYGHHSATPPALRHRNSSQQAMQQCHIVKTRNTYDWYYLLAYFQSCQRLGQHKPTYKTLPKKPPDALLNHCGRRLHMASLVPPSLRQGIQQLSKTNMVISTRGGRVR